MLTCNYWSHIVILIFCWRPQVLSSLSPFSEIKTSPQSSSLSKANKNPVLCTTERSFFPCLPASLPPICSINTTWIMSCFVQSFLLDTCYMCYFTWNFPSTLSQSLIKARNSCTLTNLKALCSRPHPDDMMLITHITMLEINYYISLNLFQSCLWQWWCLS